MAGTKQKQKYKAKVNALPATWNTFCYIVECIEDIPEQDYNKFLYFSESAPGKPINKNIGDEGYIIFESVYKKNKGKTNKVVYPVWSDT